MTTREAPDLSAPQDFGKQGFLAGPTLAVATVVIALGLRFFYVVWKYSVNIFFMDQWDYLAGAGFFTHQTTVTRLFFVEIGHREGVGLLPDMLLYPLTRWNARVDSFLIAIAIFAAMLLALRLKCRLYGALSYWDVTIPLTFLTLVQHETLLGTPNPAHSGFPLLMILLYCHALLVGNRVLRYVLVLALNFLLIFTGFGIFMAAVTIGLFLLECYWSWRRITSVPVYQAFTGLLLAIASLASFFIHYIFEPAVNCFQIPHNHLLKYLKFTGLLFSAFVVPRPLTAANPTMIVGELILFMLIFVLGWHLMHLIKSPFSETHLIGASLSGFTLLFAANTAVGRICLGWQQAFCSRYGTLLIPGFLAIYFYLSSRSGSGSRTRTLALWLTLLLPTALTIPKKDIRLTSDGKRRWADCYLREGDIHHCDKMANFQIYSDFERTDLQKKLDYLKANQLNMFAQPDAK